MSASESEQLLRFLRFLRIETSWVPLDAGQLLLKRQRARANGVAWALAGVCLVLGCIVVSSVDRTVGAVVVAVAYAVGIAGLVVRQVGVARAERALGRDLAQRYSHAVTIPIRTRLGIAGLAGGSMLLLLDAVLIVLIFDRAPASRAWTLVALSVVGSACGLALLRSALTRPVLAVDALTLTADDRLRTHDSIRALVPLYGLLMVFLVLVPPHESGRYDFALFAVAPFVANLALNHGVLSRFGTGRWDHRPRPAKGAQP